jgi:hypothetical protein
LLDEPGSLPGALFRNSLVVLARIARPIRQGVGRHLCDDAGGAGRDACVACVEADVGDVTGSFAGGASVIGQLGGCPFEFPEAHGSFEAFCSVGPSLVAKLGGRLTCDSARARLGERECERVAPCLDPSEEACSLGKQHVVALFDVACELDAPELVV